MINPKTLNYDDTNKIIENVEFTDKETYDALKRSIQSNMIEGYIPTEESVQRQKELSEGTLSMEDLITRIKKEGA